MTNQSVIMVVMGVAGSGKSVVGALLSAALGGQLKNHANRQDIGELQILVPVSQALGLLFPYSAYVQILATGISIRLSDLFRCASGT